MALADEAYASRAWIKYDDIPALDTPKIKVLRGTVQAVDPAIKSATILETSSETPRDLSYDYLVVATGLRRVWPVVPQSRTRKQYLVESGNHIKAVEDAPEGVVVVGGGAVGIEMAAELKVVKPDTKVTLVHSRDRLLSAEPLPDECKDKATELVREAGVEVLLSKRVASTTEVRDEGRTDGATVHELTFTDGEKLRASVVITAVSRSVPSSEFLPKGALNDQGLIKVRSGLMFHADMPHAEAHYAIGDVIQWSGIKRCGGAMHMGYFAAHNIHEKMLQEINGKTPKFQELGEIPPMIGLAVGKKAISYSPAQGLMSGEDVMKVFFGNDLGFDSKIPLPEPVFFSPSFSPHLWISKYILTIHNSLLELYEVGTISYWA